MIEHPRQKAKRLATTASERYLSIGDPTRIETIRAGALDLFSTR